MTCSPRIWIASVLAVTGVALVGCGSDSATPSRNDAGPPRVDSGGIVARCAPGDDPDMDSISTMDEGAGDADSDGTPNSADTDSDGDGISDADEAGDRNCTTRPVDTDGDDTPDFLDTDSNGDGILDRDQAGSDLDMDGTPDARDGDVDGDGITNVDECSPATPGGPCVDTDGDGMPDVRDDDSDGDTIRDAHEGRADVDGDMLPNFRDLDSDADGASDATEAGDGDPASPPFACPNEIDPTTGMVAGDGFADFADLDADNDGLADEQERLYGLDPCDVDSDDDGFDDLAEGAYVRVNCPDGTTGMFCDCGRSMGCGIPMEDFYVVLPYGGMPVQRDLDFGTTIRVADVHFVTDTTGSMGGTLTRVQSTVATPGTGLIDRIVEVIPDAWIGGGQHDDMPFGGYGSGMDEPYILAIRQTPSAMADAVRTAFNGIGLHFGNDGPESQTECLYQIVTGEGGTWMYAGGGGFGGAGTYTMPNYAGLCLDSGFGAPCFREAALPIVVHFSDICSHNGPPGEDVMSCDAYTGITPEPHLWTDMIAAMNRRGAKYIGINTTSTRCATVVGPSGWSPCYFMNRTAEDTSTVDLDGNPLVYDLPSGGGSDAAFTDTVIGAIETLATRVPLDVDTGLRDDPGDPEGIDATRFIRDRRPACRARPPTDPCWTAAAGVTHDQAVASTDDNTFFGVLPGTRVLFRITFQNDFVMGATTAKVFVAYIDVRGGGSSVLDTRQVYIVVPAAPIPFG